MKAWVMLRSKARLFTLQKKDGGGNGSCGSQSNTSLNKTTGFFYFYFFYFCPSSSNGDVLKTSSRSFPYSRFIFSPCYKQVDRRIITKAYKALHLGLHASNILQVIKIHYCSTPGAGLLRVIKSVTLKKTKEKNKTKHKTFF